jgi:glutaredoxin
MKIPALALLALAAAAAHAQYKVVGPDGRVTYTDRPPADAKAQPVNAGANAPTAALAQLPLALREVATRFPVTLYTAPECAPCDQGRALLRERGVPFQERTASSNDDREAWTRVVGSADAPAVSIGRQWLRGFSPVRWHEYLDTAGYPRESKLPRNYAAPPALPLVERVAAPAPEPAAPAAPPPVAEEPTPGGIRF